MDSEDFKIEVENSHNRSKRVLLRKGDEYAEGRDRLIQFKKMGMYENKMPTDVLFTLANKHITSIAKMVKRPRMYNLKTWNEKVTDLRNYTYLLDALLRDIGVK